MDRLIRVRFAFDAERPVLTVAALARRTELPLATAYRWVDRLVRAELLQKDEDGVVRPGLRLWEMASRSAPSMSLARTAMPFLLDVQAVLHQHTQLAVLDAEGVLVLERLSAREAVANQATVAGRLPPFSTSLGLVLLAFAPPGEAERFVERHRAQLGAPVRVLRPDGGGARPASAHPAVVAPTEAELRALLADVRREGHAAVDGAIDAEARGIAVPVRGPLGHAVAALGVVVPRSATSTLGVPALLMTAARGIGRALGPTGLGGDARTDGGGDGRQRA
ncbi:IclR family transcriptional regulator [Micrococcus sp. KT16]|uniref:IclR family transcriptional regulator n=1 Tax=Micrococcus sp. KT16 TaxID=2184005 RepID=UPI000DEB2680|nr:IclR family transcriptional regulator C-terminal domain-containing protein [Micrococcus sp. KT16]RBO86706.1 IclR family transcriptional regulator [Micrococcus sp. KT16]